MTQRVLSLFLAAAVVVPAAIAFAGTAPSTPPSKQINALKAGERIASNCGSGMSYCAPGDYGPGGCYKPGYGTCTAGLVCTGGMIACKPSNGGAAYCYKQGYGSCN